MGAVRGVVVAGMTLASLTGMTAPAWAAPEKQPVTPQQCEASNGTVQRADDGVGTCVGGSRYDGHVIDDVSTTPQASDTRQPGTAQPGTAQPGTAQPAPAYAPAPPGYYYSAPPAYGPVPAPQAAPAAPSGPQRSTAPAADDDADAGGGSDTDRSDAATDGSDD